MKTIVICTTCGKDFDTNRSHARFCSALCYKRNPDTKRRHSASVSAYQKKHSRDVERRYNKMIYACRCSSREMSISLDEYKTFISRECEYCGSDISNETGTGLDRINNSMGYIVSNVLPCCGVCNQIRNKHLTVEEMKVAMRAVISYRSNKDFQA